jgi:hypothetical protein
MTGGRLTYTVEEAVRFTGRTEVEIHQFIERGDIDGVKLGRRWLVLHHELMRLANGWKEAA